jgi:tRNA/rRNA methyltransferase
MITVVLIEPENAGNVGAIARCMANFDLDKLVLINPRCDHLSEEARCRAKNEQNILEKTLVKDEKYLKNFDYLIGTTARMGTDYNISRLPLHPDQLAEKLKPYAKKSKIAILFGRESVGLLNKEIALCDFVVTIPTSSKYASLNLSHAASIIFYELYKIFGENKITKHIKAATRREKDQILILANEVLDTIHFPTKEKKETQQILWQKLVGKMLLTKREAFSLMGFLRKAKKE